MMDLEIADYERTVEALNGKVAEKEKELEEYKSEIDRLEGRTKNLQEQIGKLRVMSLSVRVCFLCGSQYFSLLSNVVLGLA